MAKKPFKQTKIGRLLTSPLIKGAIKTIPFGIGSLAANVLDEVKGDDTAGAIYWPSVAPQLLKLAFYIALAIAFTKGLITFEEAENAKTLLAP